MVLRCDPRTVRFELLWLAYKGVMLKSIYEKLCFHPVTVRAALSYLVQNGYLNEDFQITDKGKERVESCLNLIDTIPFSGKPLVEINSCLVPLPRAVLCSSLVKSSEEFLECIKGKYSKVERFPQLYTNWDTWIKSRY